MWKSTDAGETWSNIGLENAGRVSRIIVHPANPDVVYVCAVGHAYAPQKERGVENHGWRKTWKQVPFVDETPEPRILSWTLQPTNAHCGHVAIVAAHRNRTSGGPGSGLYASTDGGDTWNKIKMADFPSNPWGKLHWP